MQLLAFGINHQTAPVSIREQVAFSAEILEGALQDLVSRQDWAVCERAQQGLRSRAFKFGVYPPQDEFVYEFDQEYLRARGTAPADGAETS